MNSKVALQLLQALGVAVLTAVLTYLQHVNVADFSSGVTAMIAGLVVGLLTRLVGFLINKLAPPPAPTSIR